MPFREGVLDRLSVRLIDFKKRRITNAADAIDGADYVTLDQLNKGLADVRPGADGNVIQNITNNTITGGAAIIDYHLLVANLTINAASVTPPAANTLLAVILKQDGTGGWTVTWGTDFQIGPSDLQVLPNSYSVVLFAAYSGKWYLAAPPMTGK